MHAIITIPIFVSVLLCALEQDQSWQSHYPTPVGG